jgi:hypothetical protein
VKKNSKLCEKKECVKVKREKKKSKVERVCVRREKERRGKKRG